MVTAPRAGEAASGAFVPTLALGKQLAATVEKGMKDAHPHCPAPGFPEEVREIDIDWSTGAVVT